VHAKDLLDQSGLKEILAQRPVNRDDVKSAIDQYVYFRKATEAAEKEYSRPTYRAVTKGRRARLDAIREIVTEKEIEPSLPAVSDASIQAYFVANATAFVRPAHYRFQHLFRANVPGDSRAARDKITEASHALEAGQRFEDVAHDYFKAPTERQQPENPGRVVEESAAILARSAPRLLFQLDRLSPGESSGPFPTEEGWGLVKLVEKIPRRPLTLAEARDAVRQQILAPLRQQRMRALLSKLAKSYGVERHLDRLDPKMSMGPDLVLFKIGDKEYKWRDVQRMFLFEDTRTSILMSRAQTARPLIEDLLHLYLLQRYAVAKGYDTDPRVQKAYQRAVDQELTRSKTGLDKTLAMQKEFKPTEAQMRRYYEEHLRDKYWSPAVLDLQLIYIPYLFGPREDAAEQARQRAAARRKMDEVDRKLAAGEDFGQLARRYSKHPSAAQGGRIRGGNALRMWDADRRAEFLSGPPKTYPAFEWNRGLAKVKILEASSGYALPFERVKTQIQKLDMYDEAEALRASRIREGYITKGDVDYNWKNIVQFIRDTNKQRAS